MCAALRPETECHLVNGHPHIREMLTAPSNNNHSRSHLRTLAGVLQVLSRGPKEAVRERKCWRVEKEKGNVCFVQWIFGSREIH